MNRKRAKTFLMIRFILMLSEIRIVKTLPQQLLWMKHQLSKGIKSLTLPSQFASRGATFTLIEQHPPRLCRFRPDMRTRRVTFFGALL